MRHKTTLAYIFLTALGVVPLWIVSYLPTQDGPIHLSIANALLHYHDPAVPVLRQYYLPSLIPHPNWTVYLILMPLLSVFPPTIAEKLLLSSYVILFPLAFLFLLRAIRRGPVEPPFMILPFVFNYTLLVGFYNFSLSLIFCFVLLGYWFRNARAMSPSRIMVLSLLALLVYLSHIFSFVIALLTILVMTPLVAAEAPTPDVRNGPIDHGARVGRIRASLTGTLLAFLPGLVLTVLYLQRQGLSLDSPRSILWRLQGLAGVGALMVLDKLTIVPGVAMACLLIAMTGRAIYRRAQNMILTTSDGFLLLSFALLVLYLIVPDAISGGSFVLHRLNLFVYLFLIVWLELQQTPRAIRRMAAVGAVTITVVLLGIHTRKFLQLNDEYSEYMSAASMIAPNTTVLPLRSWDDSLIPVERDPFGWRIHPFLHVAGYLSAERQIVALDNYQASQRYFPISYRPSVNPFAYLHHPQQQFLDYPTRTGGRIDYILLWGPTGLQGQEDAAPNGNNLRPLGERIEDRYDLIFRSPRSGAMRLYRLKAEREAPVSR